MTKYPFLILFIFLSLNVFASGDTSSMVHFNVDNGLPSNNVYAVTQDKYGYIWFNTDNGVVKYNGYSFKLFTISEGLPSNDVWKLYPDNMGRLWVCTHSYQIGYIKDDKYVNVITSKDKIIHPFSITCDNEKTVKFFYHEHANMTALVTIDSNDKFTKIIIDTLSPKCDNGAISDDGKAMLVLTNSRDNKVFFSRFSKGIYTFYPKPINFSLRTFNHRYGLECYNGRLLNWYEFADHFLFIDSNSTFYKAIYFDTFGGERNETMYVRYVIDDSLYIITNKAIYVFDLYFRSVRRLSTDNLMSGSPQITFYYRDKQKNEWYTTKNAGACVKFAFPDLFIRDSYLVTLSNTKCIGTLNNGATFWFNENRNDIYKLTDDKKLTEIKPPIHNIPRRIIARNDSEVYFCTDKTAYIYNVKTSIYKSIAGYFSLDTLKRYNQVLWPHIVTDKDAIKFAFNNLVHLYPISSGKWLSYSLNPDWILAEIHGKTAKLVTLDMERYSNVWFDSTDNLYLFNNINKVAVYSPVKNKFIYISNRQLQLLGINYILGIISDTYSNIYLLDNGRIIVYNVKKKQARYLQCNFNLSDVIMNVYGNNLLIAGKFGVAYAKITGPLSIGNFQVAPNINNYSRIYAFKVNSLGTIYLSTDKGFFDFSINSLLSDKRLLQPSDHDFFKIVITYPKPQKIEDGDTISISQNIPKINLDVINSLGKGTLQYSYIIDNSAGWQQSNTGEIFIGNLKANHYYKLTCFVKDSRWNSNGFVFYILRPPYWWQTRKWLVIFVIGGIILFSIFVLIVVLLTRHIVARSNERKRALTELELRAVYAQINPHFIFNTLSAALFFINKKRFDDAYVHVNKFSKLIRAYLKSSQERYVTLAEEIEMLKNYIELQRTRFEDKFEYKIEVDNKVPVKNIKIPSLLLQPLVENAINHGLFHRKEGGRLEITFMHGDSSDELICLIDDNGVGRIASKEMKNRSNIKQESYGTKLTKQLIDVFKEFEHMNISLEYVDKELPETGTKVKLIIKNVKYVT